MRAAKTRLGPDLLLTVAGAGVGLREPVDARVADGEDEGETEAEGEAVGEGLGVVLDVEVFVVEVAVVEVDARAGAGVVGAGVLGAFTVTEPEPFIQPELGQVP